MSTQTKAHHPSATFFAQVSNDFAATLPASVRSSFLAQAQMAVNDVQALADAVASITKPGEAVSIQPAIEHPANP